MWSDFPYSGPYMRVGLHWAGYHVLGNLIHVYTYIYIYIYKIYIYIKYTYIVNPIVQGWVKPPFWLLTIPSRNCDDSDEQNFCQFGNDTPLAHALCTINGEVVGGHSLLRTSWKWQSEKCVSPCSGISLATEWWQLILNLVDLPFPTEWKTEKTWKCHKVHVPKHQPAFHD